MTRFSEFCSSFRIAYTQRGIFMVLRESENYNEIFVQEDGVRPLLSQGALNFIGCMRGS